MGENRRVALARSIFPVSRRRFSRSTHARLTRYCWATTRAARPAAQATATRSRQPSEYARPIAPSSSTPPASLAGYNRG